MQGVAIIFPVKRETEEVQLHFQQFACLPQRALLELMAEMIKRKSMTSPLPGVIPAGSETLQSTWHNSTAASLGKGLQDCASQWYSEVTDNSQPYFLDLTSVSLHPPASHASAFSPSLPISKQQYFMNYCCIVNHSVTKRMNTTKNTHILTPSIFLLSLSLSSLSFFLSLFPFPQLLWIRKQYDSVPMFWDAS